MIIPFDDLKSAPNRISRDGNTQWCYYETSTDSSTPVINEHTKFPSVQEIIRSAVNGNDPPETQVNYSVFYGDVDSDVAEIEIPPNANNVWINPEPFYNEDTGKNDIFVAYVYFDENNFQAAYDYAITHPIVRLCKIDD